MQARPATLKTLLNAGADISTVDVHGKTVLMLAAEGSSASRRRRRRRRQCRSVSA